MHRFNDYDAVAAEYSSDNDENLVNAFYERPAMLALAGDVSGRRILDAGCGSGALTAALLDRGADVIGIDASAGMLRRAAERLGGPERLRPAALGEPLPFPDGWFDDVIASLVLHYLPDWDVALRELRRVLRPGGRLLASVDHPIVAYTLQDPRPDYAATTSYDVEWRLGGRSIPMRFWRRSLQTMVDEFAAAGFRLTGLHEPRPATEAFDRYPEEARALASRPVFLFLTLEAERG